MSSKYLTNSVGVRNQERSEPQLYTVRVPETTKTLGFSRFLFDVPSTKQVHFLFFFSVLVVSVQPGKTPKQKHLRCYYNIVQMKQVSVVNKHIAHRGRAGKPRPYGGRILSERRGSPAPTGVGSSRKGGETPPLRGDGSSRKGGETPPLWGGGSSRKSENLNLLFNIAEG